MTNASAEHYLLVQRTSYLAVLSYHYPSSSTGTAVSVSISITCTSPVLTAFSILPLGACGWFALYCKGDTPDRYVGGVELTLSFTREEDRELVLSHAARLGWKPNPIAELSISPCATQLKLRFEVTIDSLWVSVDDVIIPVSGEPSYKCCFVRYRFFSLGEIDNPVL